MVLTTKEKRLIRSTIRLLIKDIRKLVKDYPESKITVFAFQEEIGNYGSNWYLEITAKEIILREKYKESNSLISKGQRRNIIIDNDDYLAQYHFIKNYDLIRKNIEEIVNKKLRQIQENVDLMNSTRNKYKKKMKEKKTKKATIEIDLPPSNNQYELEVSEENGKTIGKLNFNGLTLTLLASDGVRIVNKPKNKQKIK
ncbi:MAG: hypothetical protein E7162_04195 [Firmicutes bacterium]|nr:hypothetical protein [Bacillota bacterium]